MPRIAASPSFAASEVSTPDAGERFDHAFAAIWAHCPAAATAWRAFGAALEDNALLAPRLTELVCLRIAFHNQCRSCMAMRSESAIEDGLSEEVVCSLERPHELPGLSDAERAALRLADLFATDHLAIDDAELAALRLHFGEPEIVELLIQCARFVGFGRLAATAAVYEDLPRRFHTAQAGPYTPWDGDVIVRAAR